MPYNKPYITNNIKELRKGAMMRQKDLAHILGFEDEVRISAWEHGNAMPNAINLMQLCFVFNTTPQEIYPGLHKELGENINKRVGRTITMRNEEVSKFSLQKNPAATQ